MNNKILLFLLLMFGAFGLRLNAQSLFECPSGSIGASTCGTSCINCNLDGITGRTDGFIPNGFTYCHDEFVATNPRFFGFVAGSTSITLGIAPTNCTTGAGLEYAIVENCSNVLECFPGPLQTGAAGQNVITLTGLVIGRPYQFVIDGYNGDVCDFEINVIFGSTQGPPMSAITPIEGLSQVCPNATTTYTITPVANALTYTWTAPAGASINGGGSVRVLPATGGNNSVEVHFGNAGGSVCVTASNACSPVQTVCLPVSNVPIAPTQLEDAVICFGEIPYAWPEEPHTFLAAPGTYNLTSTPYVSYLGCDSIVKQKLTVLPLNQTNLPVRYLCKNECYNINGLDYCETGNYQEHLPSFNGCDSLVNFTLIRIPAKAVIAKPDTITCAVTSVPLSGVGSTAANTVSYKWLNPAGQIISNAITATATEPGLHSLIVTNFVGGVSCMDTAVVNVPGNLTPPQADAGPDKVINCTIPQVTLNGSGSVGPDFTYFWKAQLGGNIVSGSTTLNPIVNAPGTYTLRVTNNHNGCTAISNAQVTALVTPPTVTAAGGTFTCATPSINLQVATDASNPSYSWEGPNSFTSTLQNPSVNVAGSYTVTVTDGITSCINYATVTVIAGTDNPDVDATGGAITCTAPSVTLNASSAVPGVTYQWTGPNGFTSGIANPSVTEVGNYQVVALAPNGCTNTASTTVALNNTPPGTTLDASGSLNCNNATVNVLATSNGTPINLNHDWTLPGGGTQNTGANAFLATSTPGIYAVLVTNTANGCTSTASYTVVQYPNVAASIDKLENTKCFDSNDGSLSVLSSGGNGVYSYNWSNGPTTALNPDLGPGVYIATITDGEGCTATVSGTVTAPAQINTNATATAQTSNGASDGTATANPTGGTPGFTYLWSNTETTQTISGLLPGSYTVTVTDANGCTAVKTVNVNQFDCFLQTELTTEDISCFGAANGSATINFLGGVSPYTVAWSSGQSTNSISGLAAGPYTVSITDAANCPQVQSFTILEPQALQANASGSTTTGPGSDDGTASANPTGGSGTYTYSWSNSGTTATISNLPAGTYTVTVQDENGCQDVQTVEVLSGNCNLSTDFISTNPTCNGGANGEATIVLTGGAGTFSFAWSTGGTAATETGLTAGSHTVSVTDENGCTVSATVELAAPPALTIALESSQPTSCPNLPAGTATVSTSGGTGALAVSWSDGQNGPTATALIAGTFTAVVTDGNGCTASLPVTIASEDTEAPTIVAANVDVPIGPDGNVLLTPQNMNATVADNCHLASVVIQPNLFQCTELGDHDVTITATDDAGHTTSQTVTVTIVDDAPPTLICSPSLVLCFEDNPVSYQAPTATDNCLINGGMFQITAGLPIGATFPVGSTTTTYTFTDAQGNMGTCSFEVTILSPLAIEVDTVINDFNFQSVGAIFVNVSGSLAPYNYLWTLNGQQVSTQQNPTGLAAGDYTVVVTDDNGCTITIQTVTVSNTSDTKSPSLLEGIRVFPNPTSGNLSVLLPDDLVGKNVFMQIYDQTGRQVMTQSSFQDKQINLDLLGLSDGLYSLVVRIDREQIVRNIVVNR